MVRSKLASPRPGPAISSEPRRGSFTPGAVGLLDLDEDALAGALLGGLDDGLVERPRHVGQALGPTRVREDLVTLLDVRQPVVEQREHVGGDLLAEPVA